MKVCPGCNSVMNDNVLFCTVCGTKINEATDTQNPDGAEVNGNAYADTKNSGAYNSNNTSYERYGYDNSAYDNAGGAFTADQTDHTAEFDAQDISSNKTFAMLAYIGGIVGLLIAVLMKKESLYLDFHIRQSIKIYITELICIFIGSILSWLIIPMIVAAIAVIVLLVVRIICFVQVAQGQSKEPAIVKSLDFLK